MVKLLQSFLVFLSIYGIFADDYSSNNDEHTENIYPFIKIGSKYYFINESLKMNWFEASNYCRSYGGELASIESHEELLALQNYILARKLEKRLWFDGNDLAQEGKFVSHTTGRPLIFIKWIQNNPNNANDNEDCLEVYMYNKELFMNDYSCGGKLLAICKYREPNTHCSGKNMLMNQNEVCILRNLVESFAKVGHSCKSCSQACMCPTS